jgi:hypothetical protein
MKHIYVLASLVLWCFSLPFASAQTDRQGIPCRIRDGENRDLFVMTLGDVKTPIAQGLFYPNQDQVKLNDGSSLDYYYRDTLGIRHYSPIDKSVFPSPPSGWCSWYFYFYEISEGEIRRNVKWLSDNLREYGLQYIQIDDGWQGVGRGFNTNRDWTTINDRFPGGMKNLAADIKKFGFKPGLWIAPHGQSSVRVVQANQKAFLLKPDGTTLSDTWEGSYGVSSGA